MRARSHYTKRYFFRTAILLPALLCVFCFYISPFTFAQDNPVGERTTVAPVQTQDPGPSCSVCNCNECPKEINQNHKQIRAHVTSEFEQHRSWIVTTFWIDLIVPALIYMTDELTANMVQQVQIIGAFFDAKHQLETQRLFQSMTAQAHKDYHPSEELCMFGTNVQSLAASEKKSKIVKSAMANGMIARQLSSGQNLAFDGPESDRKSRLKQFINKFCRRSDNGGNLSKVCAGGGQNPAQENMDVNYTSALENKLTLEVDFSNEGGSDLTEDEENIFALGANLFGHEVLPNISGYILASNPDEVFDIASYYLDMRAVVAKRSVAQNSFANIVALKAEGDGETAPFLKAILKEAGVNEQDIEARLGEKPSYFAQMEVLTKDIYQNPSFYANLYDKPVNVERKGIALQAIELMQDRDIYQSLLRSEAVLATLIETTLLREHSRITAELENVDVMEVQ